MSNVLAFRRVDAMPAPSRLATMAQQRPILQAPLQAALARHRDARSIDLDLWAAAVLRLAHVNAGAIALLAMLRLTATTPPGLDGLRRMAQVADAAADICRRAGSMAVRATLDARLALGARLGDRPAGEEGAWWRSLVRLARDAPDCVAAMAGASATMIERCGAAHAEAFVAAGLRSSTQTEQRRAFFALESVEARRLLDRLSGAVTFTDMQNRLVPYAAALWGREVPLRERPPMDDAGVAQRTTISSGIVLLPDLWRGVPREQASAHYRASVAHASAHLALGGPLFDCGHLKPVQIVLVGLIEDARIEARAMERFPGLRSLWAPFHTVEASHLKTAPLLLARIARGLFDPRFVDGDGIVAKARALFAAEPDLADPGLSRRIGGLIGNDIGQMRIQFDARRHVVEPVYRDDNLGLWALPPPPADASLPNVEMMVQSARVERRPDEGRDTRQGEPDETDGAGRAKAVPPDECGVAIALYPEWDRAAGVERPDWVTVRDVEPARGGRVAADVPDQQDRGLRRRVERLVRNARVGRPMRLRRQPDGLDLDLDATVDAALALRMGELPDDRIHTRKVLRSRDLAVLVLVDTSESTRDRVPAADASVLSIEKRAVAVLAGAMDALGDRFALRAFASNGRNEVRIVRIKDFDGVFDDEAKTRLAGLEPGYSTRLGAALRHAGAELDRLAATRRIVIALTDGAPSDIDVADPLDLVEDARRAARGLFNRGIDVFGMTLDPTGQGAGAAVFGRTNCMPVRHIEDLPSRLSELYFRIARR